MLSSKKHTGPDTPSAASSWSGTRHVLYSITKHAMRRSADEIRATSISFGRKYLAIRHRLLTEFFPPIESASATDSAPAGRANRQAGADIQCRRLSFVGWSLRICFSSTSVGRPPGVPRCPSREFRLLDVQLTEADRRPFKLPLQLGELPIEPAEERLRSLRVALRRRRYHANLAENRKCGLSQRHWS